MDIVHIGKAKTVYRTENVNEYLMEFRDDVTAFNGKRKTTVPDKGRYNAQISARLFELLEQHGVATHYKALVGDARMLVKAVEIIPLEIIARNIAAGSVVSQVSLQGGAATHPARARHRFQV